MRDYFETIMRPNASHGNDPRGLEWVFLIAGAGCGSWI